MTSKYSSFGGRESSRITERERKCFGKDSEIVFGPVEIEEMAAHLIRNVDQVVEDVSMQLGTKVTLKIRICTEET